MRWLALFASISVAAAEPLSGSNALPGGERVSAALTPPRGTFTASIRGGVGFTQGLLGDEHSTTRIMGTLGGSYGLADGLGVSLRFRAHHESHSGPVDFASPGLEDDEDTSGFVGMPLLVLRYTRPIGAFHLGAEIEGWFPGEEFPSFSVEGASVAGKVLASYGAGSWMAHLNVGGRLDRSDESLTDTLYTPRALSSLGVSEFSALLAGARFEYATKSTAYGFEVSSDVFLGEDAPRPMFRFGADGRYTFGQRGNTSVSLSVSVTSQEAPEAPKFRLIAYEPVIVAQAGFTWSFGASASASEIAWPPFCKCIGQDDSDCGALKRHPDGRAFQCPVWEPPPSACATLSGQIVDATGVPLPAATVRVTGTNRDGVAGTVERVSDADGKFQATDLGAGDATIEVELAGYQAANARASLTTGSPVCRDAILAPIVLTKAIASGEIRGKVIASKTGKPISRAVIVVTSSTGEVTQVLTDDLGDFQIQLSPGTYDVSAEAPKSAPKQFIGKDVRQGEVLILNFDLK